LPAHKIGKLWKLRLSEVDAWMRSAGGRRASSTEAAGSAAWPTVFVMGVDDDEALRETLAEFLADAGYGTLLASDGSEALEILRSPSSPRPQLMLIDLVMPRMDGWALREAQLRDPELRSIPVILMTDERRADLGGNVIRKPLDLAVLGEAIRKHLEGGP